MAAGDFDGNDREFLLVNDQYIGAGGLEESGAQFITEAANVANCRLCGSSVPIGITGDDRVFTRRFVSPDVDTIVKAGRSGILFFPLQTGGRGFRLEGAHTMAVYPGDSSGMLPADLNGDGTDVLVERTYLGSLRRLRMLGVFPEPGLASILRFVLSAQRPIWCAFPVNENFGLRRALCNDLTLARESEVFPHPGFITVNSSLAAGCRVRLPREEQDAISACE